MPMIKVEMFPGRTTDQKRRLAKAITDSFIEICGGKAQSVHVVFADVPMAEWAVAGELCSDRAAAAAAVSDKPLSQPVACAYDIVGQGPALFLIHGIGARRSVWDKVVEELKGDFTCITYDLRGHGDSPLPQGTSSLGDLVGDLEALRAKLGIEGAHFAGHSLGGMIGPAYARRFPDRVLSLGLISTAAFRTEDDSAKVKGLVATMRAEGIANTLKTMVARWFTDDFAAAHPEVVQRRLDQVTQTDPQVFLNVFDIYAGTEMSPWLSEVKAPALVMTGELDGGCSPRLNTKIAEALPDSELVILEGVKHAVMLEAPSGVAANLRRFLLEHGGAGAETRAIA